MSILPYYPRCFVCGDAHEGQLGVRFRQDGDAIMTQFTDAERRTGYKNVIHGGVLDARLDETMDWVPCLQGERCYVAVELTVRLVRPAPIGIRQTIRGEITAQRGRLHEANGEIHDAKGNLYAPATAKYMPLADDLSRERAQCLEHEDAARHLDWVERQRYG